MTSPTRGGYQGVSSGEPPVRPTSQGANVNPPANDTLMAKTAEKYRYLGIYMDECVRIARKALDALDEIEVVLEVRKSDPGVITEAAALVEVGRYVQSVRRYIERMDGEES